MPVPTAIKGDLLNGREVDIYRGTTAQRNRRALA